MEKPDAEQIDVYALIAVSELPLHRLEICCMTLLLSAPQTMLRSDGFGSVLTSVSGTLKHSESMEKLTLQLLGDMQAA